MLGIRQLDHHQPNARRSRGLLRFITCGALIDTSHFHALARLFPRDAQRDARKQMSSIKELFYFSRGA